MVIERGKVRLSDRIVFGLIAVAILSPANKDQATSRLDGYYLTFGDSPNLLINEWWGRATDFPEILARDSIPVVELDFGSWMT